MNDPFVTFDTLTIGAEFENAASTDGPAPAERPKLPSILARLPLLPPRPQVRTRFDEAETMVPTAHHTDEALATDSTPGVAQKPPLLGDPTATIRFDTVGPYPVSPETAASTATPARRAEIRSEAPKVTLFQPAAAVSASDVSEGELEDPWSAWLLNLEAAIQPYSRWIALAAVVAALGLTIVLLRGGGGAVDPPGVPPQVSTDSANEALAVISTTEVSPNSEVEPWLTPEPVADLKEPETVAVGPVSAPRPAGHAKLTGELLPTETTRVADSSANDPYSRTTR